MTIAEDEATEQHTLEQKFMFPMQNRDRYHRI